MEATEFVCCLFVYCDGRKETTDKFARSRIQIILARVSNSENGGGGQYLRLYLCNRNFQRFPHRTLDKVQEPNDPECYTTSSESFRICVYRFPISGLIRIGSAELFQACRWTNGWRDFIEISTGTLTRSENCINKP
jgi:hypothetical protein